MKIDFDADNLNDRVDKMVNTLDLVGHCCIKIPKAVVTGYGGYGSVDLDIKIDYPNKGILSSLYIPDIKLLDEIIVPGTVLKDIKCTLFNFDERQISTILRAYRFKIGKSKFAFDKNNRAVMYKSILN